MRIRSLLLVHGSGSDPSVWEGWLGGFAGTHVEAVDLQRGLDVAHATMADYAAAVVRAGSRLERPLAVCAWSLGGLAAMVAAERLRPDALVLLEPSPPAEVQGVRDEVVPEPGTFDPVSPEWPFPPGVRSRPESTLAYGERRRGVSVPALPGRVLVVYGDGFRHDRGPILVERYGVEGLDAGAATHWDLVLDPQWRGRVAEWLQALPD